jgi:hypothetical protein
MRVRAVVAHRGEQIEKAVVGGTPKSDGNVGPGLMSGSDDLLDDRGDRFGGLVVELTKIFLIKLQKGDDPVSDVLIHHCVAVVS